MLPSPSFTATNAASESYGADRRPSPPGAAVAATNQTTPETLTVTVAGPEVPPAPLTVYWNVSGPSNPRGGSYVKVPVAPFSVTVPPAEVVPLTRLAVRPVPTSSARTL
ncbi:MAG: hypothetical protein DYH06_11885 [Acidobacteria bacterium ACB2]|nr:hypothetical protein [Acidobacteria bacterium ACB2]